MCGKRKAGRKPTFQRKRAKIGRPPTVQLSSWHERSDHKPLKPVVIGAREDLRSLLQGVGGIGVPGLRCKLAHGRLPGLRRVVAAAPLCRRRCRGAGFDRRLGFRCRSQAEPHAQTRRPEEVPFNPELAKGPLGHVQRGLVPAQVHLAGRGHQLTLRSRAHGSTTKAKIPYTKPHTSTHSQTHTKRLQDTGGSERGLGRTRAWPTSVQGI